MTVTTRTSAPLYKIFEPDALDAIYAKGSLDPIMGGIAGAMGMAHKQETMNNQGDYLASQERFNKQAANIDAMEIGQKYKEALLKGAVALLGHGAATTDLEPGALAGLYNSKGYNNDTLGIAMRNKMAADAQHARASGGDTEYKERTAEVTTDAASGKQFTNTYGGRPRVPATPTDLTGTTPTANKGNPDKLAAAVAAAKLATGDPDATYGRTKEGYVGAYSTKTGKTAIVDPNTGKQINR